MNKLEDYILVLENIIPEKLCDDILNEYIDSDEWRYTAVGIKVEVRKEVRNCTTIEMSSKQSIEKNKNVREYLDQRVFECVKKACTEYNKKFIHAFLQKDSGYNLLKYEKNGFFLQHTDSYITIPRTVSCSINLNDNFKGGEFSFFDNKFKYSLKKGSAIMFPSNFQYPHSIQPVIDGTRYSIVTWFI
jgi:predicted 2-oxoglutarate/Fe(II)-dependent dioxygenase YbiX